MSRELQLGVDLGHGRRAGVEVAVRTAIGDGRLQADDPLPSTRSLAADLGVSRATVVAAYEQLAAEGYIVTRQGGASRVAGGGRPPEAPADDDAPAPPVFAADFRPGQPDLSAFPRKEWRRSMRRALDDAPDAALGYPDDRGIRELRVPLAAYLNRARTTDLRSEALHVVPGFGAGLVAVAEALAGRGIRRMAVEDPMLFVHRWLLRSAGLDCVPIPVDDDGLRVDILADTDVDAVLVCPAHQYPMGGTLSADRRAHLAAWVGEGERWIVEDDYDGEFRYDRRPVGAIQRLAPDRVVYAGTASKTLAPGLRLAWLGVPTDLHNDVRRAGRGLIGVSAIEQLTFADFVERGVYDRQVRAMRVRYRRRRDALQAALAPLSGVRVPHHAAGLHVTARFVDPSLEEAAVEAACATRSVGVFGLRRHFADTPTAAGLVLGFARPAEHGFDAALDELVEALGQAVPSSP